MKAYKRTSHLLPILLATAALAGRSRFPTFGARDVSDAQRHRCGTCVYCTRAIEKAQTNRERKNRQRWARR